jgi:hypothetical protein
MKGQDCLQEELMATLRASRELAPEHDAELAAQFLAKTGLSLERQATRARPVRHPARGRPADPVLVALSLVLALLIAGPQAFNHGASGVDFLAACAATFVVVVCVVHLVALALRTVIRSAHLP